MDNTRLRQLAGLPTKQDPAYTKLLEVVQLGDDLSLMDLVDRLDACSRALKIVNSLQDPQDRKKWMSATFVNLNKVRGALQRALRAEGFPVDDAAVVSGMSSGKKPDDKIRPVQGPGVSPAEQQPASQ